MTGGALSVPRIYGTTSGTAAQGNDSRITGALQASNNLSDLANSLTALHNIGALSTGGVIDARFYGAKCNGTTDDTAAINAALAARSPRSAAWCCFRRAIGRQTALR